MKNTMISGLYVPMVTPFQDDESIDFLALDRHVDFLIENGVDGLIPCGSTGEFIAMDENERMSVVERVVEHNAGRAIVYASTGHYSTRKTIELSKHAEEVGADGLMVITPYYLIRNEVELYEHFRRLRDAVSIPIMLYHNPHFSATKLSDEFIARCYNNGLVDSLKEGEGELARLSNIRSMTDDRFALFYGFDACVVESLAMAADGWVAGTGNLLPRENKAIYELMDAGKIEAARILWYRIKKVIDLCIKPTDEGIAAPWLAILKEGLAMRGNPVGTPRKPTLPLSPAMHHKVKSALIDLGLCKN